MQIFRYKTMKTLHHILNRITRKDNLILISGISLGLAGGFLYYYFIGCRTGTCPITSSPWLSMLWGATVGYLISDLFRKKTSTEVKSKE